MPPPQNFEDIPLFSSSLRPHRRCRALSFSPNPHLRALALFTSLIVTGSLLVGLYLSYLSNNQGPFSLHPPTNIFIPPSATEEPCDNSTVIFIPPPQSPPGPISHFYPPNSSAFYLLFTPTVSVPADTCVRRIPAHDIISDDCIEEWLGSGRWAGDCLRLILDEPRVDLVWSWVNGSDPLHRAARETYRPPLINGRPTGASQREKEYRQHDELRFSLRSAKFATSSWKQTTFHLVANSYPVPSLASDKDEDGSGKEMEVDLNGRRLGQVPQWLDLGKIADGATRFIVHHDVDLFRPLPSPLDHEVSEAELTAWRTASIPTFNSLAIESQLANLPPSDVADATVFIMDDNYFLRQISPTTFFSPIHGPVLHLQPDLLVKPKGARLQPGSGEWRGLEKAASLLSERFGTRGRPYLVHNARSIPLPLLHEASLAFPSDFTETATSRFRGQSDSKVETHTLWLATHFIVERHREALLWSWVVGKWGGQKGIVTREEKQKMWRELGGDSDRYKKVWWPKRESRLSTKGDLKNMALPDPGTTDYTFVSSDGYPYTYLPLSKVLPAVPKRNGWPDLAKSPTGENSQSKVVACTIRQDECLKDDTTESAAEMLKRIMVDQPQCGDCIISALIASSGSTGFSAFLPPHSSSPSFTSSSSTPPIHLPLTITSLLTFPYPSTNPRLFSLRLIQRYSYVLGSTASRFFGVEGANSAASQLKASDVDKETVMLCINDDLLSTQPKIVEMMDNVLKHWMCSRWPDRLWIERAAAEGCENVVKV